MILDVDLCLRIKKVIPFESLTSLFAKTFALIACCNKAKVVTGMLDGGFAELMSIEFVPAGGMKLGGLRKVVLNNLRALSASTSNRNNHLPSADGAKSDSKGMRSGSTIVVESDGGLI